MSNCLKLVHFMSISVNAKFVRPFEWGRCSWTFPSSEDSIKSNFTLFTGGPGKNRIIIFNITVVIRYFPFPPLLRRLLEFNKEP